MMTGPRCRRYLTPVVDCVWRTTIRSLVIGTVLALAAGCGVRKESGTSAPPPRDTLRIAVATDVQSLDPAIAYDTYSWPLVRILYHGLLDYDDAVNLVPWLAERLPVISADGRSYTFRLREDVHFSNGRELVAEDFVYSLERILDPKTKSPGEGFFRNIAGAREFQKARGKEGAAAKGGHRRQEGRWMEPTSVKGLKALDRYTLQIKLDQPDLAFLNILAMPFSYAVPKEAVAKYGKDFFRNPVGTGPFVLKEWVRGMKLRFERNESYSLKLSHPTARSLEVMIGPDALLRQMMFERGELDVLDDIPAPDFARVKSDRRLKPCISSMPLNATMYLALNCEMKPFTDVRVRQAINYAVDKDRLLKIVNGRGVPAKGVLPPLMPGYNPRLKGYPYDPGKAKQLLAQAGLATGFSLPLWVSVNHAERVKMAESVQQDLTKVGIKVEIKAVSFAVWDEAAGRRKNTPFVFSGWYQDYPDPSNFLDVLLSGDRIVKVHCNNYAFYSNSRVNSLLRQAGRETDPGLRLKLYQQAEEIIVEDAPWVFLYHPTLYMLHQPWVKGHKMHPVWPEKYEELWFDWRSHE